MTQNEYQRRVESFMNPETLKSEDRRLTNALLGLAEEVGELNGIYKKSWFQSKPFDLNNAKKEAGDIYFYLAEYCSSIGTTLEEIALLNVDKLSRRFPNGFSAEDSMAKADEK